ncbi:hypothetical protein [Agromyces sp. SYSU T00194]|uniref:hypothetical protein n=1 Tax=Agromyces chitinivorans TaxID=3158560 RepID=UPI003397AFF9
MEIAELVLAYIKVLVWPLVVVLALLLFRRQFARMFGRVIEARGFGAMLKLTEDVAEAAEVSESLPELAEAPELPSEPAGSGPLPEDQAGRMLFAWNRLESAAVLTARRLGLSPMASLNLGVLARELQDRDLVGAKTANLMRDLQGVRNKLVHASVDLHVGEGFADDFVDALGNLERVLRAIK